MSSIDEMLERHKKEIEKLQAECKHEKKTGWMEHQWAIGHGSGFEVKLCEDCHKVVRRRRLKEP